MYLIFDTETTGLPRNYAAPITDLENWPRLVQLAWQRRDHTGKLISSGNYIIKPEGFTIPYNSEKIHGISTQRALKEGEELEKVLHIFRKEIDASYFLVGHNVSFDEKVMGAEFLRKKIASGIMDIPKIDTKDESTDFCAIPGARGYKWPTLMELHKKLFGYDFEDAHDASADVDATVRAFLELIRIGVIKINFPLESKLYKPATDYIIRQNYMSADSAAEAEDSIPEEESEPDTDKEEVVIATVPDEQPVPKETGTAIFTHLHCHSKFSVLQATAGVKELVEFAKKQGMQAVGLTDLGNMYGAFAFVSAAKNAGIKPILGSEFYVVDDRHRKRFTRDDRDKRYQIPLLAKNQNGYKNLAKLSSISFVEGYYYKYPRIDKEAIKKYSADIICLSGGQYGMIADLILNKGEAYAEEELGWWIDTFGDDFYLEVMNHDLEEEKRVNEVLFGFAQKYGVKIAATNDVFYLNKEDADAHDALLCIDNRELVSTPIGKGRDFRYGFPNKEFYFKTADEMQLLFADHPEVLANTQEIVNKVELINLSRDIVLPHFELPEGFASEDDYLKHMAFEGAQVKYTDVDDSIINRIDLELEIISNMGFSGYFLIVQDFIAAAKKMGVFVGPGRGSAAGSVVAYSIGITNIDPLKYDLLFERFLNPERISMPDIDIDFDDEGRQKVIDYVVKKYGQDQVAHIITFGSMAARSSVRDVARVLDLPLSEADRIAKLVPVRPGTTLDDAFNEVKELRDIRDGNGLEAETMKMAKVLEGSIRNTGIHAAGIIIAPDDLTKFIPICTAKDTNLYVTQYDGSVIESAGMLKMDFLGLKTLSVLKKVINYVKENHGIEYNLDDIPLDDEKTFRLYQKGSTLGTFQFESEGMRKYLKDLKPTDMNDLIAMNALYRPGPMQFIPDYINRKKGLEKVEYDHEYIRDILEPTYGIMIYQEQIMSCAQKLANYTLGEADLLRRIMGKKKHEEMVKQEQIFIDKAIANNIEPQVAKDIFDKMAMFASYGFNKSHSAAYSVVAYHTMYFKANYPAEYMAAAMTHNMDDLKKIALFIEECQRLNIPVDQPNINTARGEFVARNGRVQYGMAAIKGMGSAAMEFIVKERAENGDFKSVFDFASRMDSGICNRRTFENLIMAGAFDELNDNRAQLLESVDDILAYAAVKQQEKRLNQTSLFGGATGSSSAIEPKLKSVPMWGQIERLNYEKELTGFYLSGHPLNKYSEEIGLFGKQNLSSECLEELSNDNTINFIAVITEKRRHTDQRNRPMLFLMVEDLYSSHEVVVYSTEYDKYAPILEVDNVLYITGRYSKRDRGDSIVLTNAERVENLLERFQDKLCLQLSVNTGEVSSSDLVKLEQLFQINKGNTTIQLSIYSDKANAPIKMKVRNFVVEPSHELLRNLREILGSENVMIQMPV